MVDEIIIRECGEDEDQAVLGLWQQVGNVVLSPTDNFEEVQAAIHHSAALFLVAESEGRMLGVTAEKSMAEQGCHRITALVGKDHPWATGFWTTAGYELHESMSRYFRDV